MTLPPEALKIPSRLLANAIVLPERDAIVPLLPKNSVFAEVGVGTGNFSRLVLSVSKPSLFIAIDEFRLHELSTLWGQPADDVFKGQTHAEAYRSTFAAEIHAGRMRVLEGDSAVCLERLDDASVDVIYIDADHRYDWVRRDLDVARRKVTDDGWIIVNDYIMVTELKATLSYGVVQATNEFMVEHDWAMQYFALQTRMFCDVALRPARCLECRSQQMLKLTEEVQACRDEIALLRESTSWKITAPIRKSVGLSRRLWQNRSWPRNGTDAKWLQ